MALPSVDAFLEGPRARSLCTSLLAPSLQTSWWNGTSTTPGTFAWTPIEIERAAASFAEALERFVPDAWSMPEDLLPAFDAAIVASRPWQPPDAIDAIAELEVIRRRLKPVADAVLASAAAAWWETDCVVDDQWWVASWGGESEHSMPQHAEATRRRWRSLTRESETTRDTSGLSPRDVARGEWWAKPGIWHGPGRAAALPSSTRRLGPLGAVELALMEDSFGPERATLRRLLPPADARIFEVHVPEDWVRLVDAYPISVRWARRGTWWQSTGLDADWRLPDFAAAGEDWDGIHVSPIGYLTTGGRPLAAGGGMTMLAGWDPDATFWLTDVTVGEPESWTRTDEDRMDVWEPAPLP